MHISKFSRWLLSFFSSVKKETHSGSKSGLDDTSYRDLLAKVDQLEALMKEETQKNERLKTCFLNNIYHEIRTPMNSIVGFAELLKHDDLTDEKKSLYMSKITQSSNEFLKIIDHLLEASLIESGNIVLEKSEFCLPQMFNELHSYFNIQKHILDKSNIALLKNTDKYYPNLSIISDRKRLYQILSNLVGNAIKFSNRGVIEFGFKVLNSTQIMFFVKDSGTGITNIIKTDLFESFVKSDYCYGKENRGLGLGLSIAKGLINNMGGKIWVENDNNFGGATFKFTIPVEQSSVKVTEILKEKMKLSKMLYL